MLPAIGNGIKCSHISPNKTKIIMMQNWNMYFTWPPVRRKLYNISLGVSKRFYLILIVQRNLLRGVRFGLDKPKIV